MENKQSPKVLPESVSLFLDFIRLAAALFVVATHVAVAAFALQYPNLDVLGHIAVPLFFVLSGFVIRFVTGTRESTAREYFIDRASRIYSVVLPAMALTLLISLVCFLLDRSEFTLHWSDTFSHPLARLFFNLTFFSQAWGRNTIPFINVPFWSLGYECIYYLCYGFLFYLRGWRRILFFLLTAVAIGPQVMFLFPIWWLGCLLYDVYIRFRRTRLADGIVLLTLAWLLIGLVWLGLGKDALLMAPVHGFNRLASLPNPLGLLGFEARRATMLAFSVGVWSTIALVPILFAADRIHIATITRPMAELRRVANATFVIYLMHYPFLVLLKFLHLQRPHHLVSNLAAWTAMCILLVLIAEPTDLLKIWMRKQLRAIIPSEGTKRSSSRSFSISS